MVKVYDALLHSLMHSIYHTLYLKALLEVPPEDQVWFSGSSFSSCLITGPCKKYLKKLVFYFELRP